jgi:AbrB family looped-hinge helix DNA binding protein
MVTATLTSKGQITIPAVVRASLGLRAGDRIEFIANANGEYSILPATGSINDLQGFIRKPKKPVTIADMNKAIALMGSRSE